MKSRAQLVYENHHLGQGRIISDVLVIVGDLLDCLMENPLQGRGIFRVAGNLRRQAFPGTGQFTPDLAQETVNTFNPLGIPRLLVLQWTHEHEICPQAVRPVALDVIIGIGYVTAAF